MCLTLYVFMLLDKWEFFNIFSAFLKKRRHKLQAKLSQSSIQYKCTQQSDGSILFHLSKQQQAEDLSKEGQCRYLPKSEQSCPSMQKNRYTV